MVTAKEEITKKDKSSGQRMRLPKEYGSEKTKEANFHRRERLICSTPLKIKDFAI